MTERGRRAYELRASGMSWAEIAMEVGYTSPSGAHNAATRYIGGRAPTVPRAPRRSAGLKRMGGTWVDFGAETYIVVCDDCDQRSGPYFQASEAQAAARGHRELWHPALRSDKPG